jgi:hypothetical protein
MNADVKGAVDFVVGITTALATGGVAGAAKFGGEAAAGAAKGAAIDMGKAVLTEAIKEFLPNLKATEQAVAASKAAAASMIKDAEASELKAAALALKEAGQGAEAVKTDLEEKAIDVSIKQKTLETALSNAGLPGMATAMAARAKAQVQHTKSVEALARFEGHVEQTKAAGAEASGAYWAAIDAGCAPAGTMEFPISNKADVTGPAQTNATEAMTLSVWAESQKKFGDETRKELGEYLASYEELVTMLRAAMGA